MDVGVGEGEWSGRSKGPRSVLGVESFPTGSEDASRLALVLREDLFGGARSVRCFPHRKDFLMQGESVGELGIPAGAMAGAWGWGWHGNRGTYNRATHLIIGSLIYDVANKAAPGWPDRLA